MQAGDIERHLAGRLAGIEKVKAAVLPAKLPGNLCVLHQAGISGDVGNGYQLWAVFSDDFFHGCRVEPSFRPAFSAEKANTRPFLQLEKGDLVGDIVIFCGQNDVSGLKRDRR